MSKYDKNVLKKKEIDIFNKLKASNFTENEILDTGLFLKKTNDSFDLIFADPPYDKIDYDWLFNSCIKKLSKNGKLVVEMKKNNFTYDNCIEKVYGDTKVLLYNKS